MICVISGSNRDNNTKKVALEYIRFLGEKQVDVTLLTLDAADIMYRDEQFIRMEDSLLVPASKYIIVMPEYNGSYPGILKLMIDNTDVPKVWWHKKVLLTGVSTGRAGNLRGMDHITGCLLHMKMLVHPNRLPISVINTLMDEHHRFTDIPTIKAIQTQLEEFLQF